MSGRCSPALVLLATAVLVALANAREKLQNNELVPIDEGVNTTVVIASAHSWTDGGDGDVVYSGGSMALGEPFFFRPMPGHRDYDDIHLEPERPMGALVKYRIAVYGSNLIGSDAGLPYDVTVGLYTDTLSDPSLGLPAALIPGTTCSFDEVPTGVRALLECDATLPNIILPSGLWMGVEFDQDNCGWMIANSPIDCPFTGPIGFSDDFWVQEDLVAGGFQGFFFGGCETNTQRVQASFVMNSTDPGAPPHRGVGIVTAGQDWACCDPSSFDCLNMPESACLDLGSDTVPMEWTLCSDLIPPCSEPRWCCNSGATERVSVTSDGRQGNDGSGGFSVSADGRYVAFDSWASNLVPGDTNGPRWEGSDVFVHDRVTRQTTRVSVASDGTQGNDSSGGPCISADGRYVAFSSYASNLVPGDTNGPVGDEYKGVDVFVHDRVTRQTMRVSVASDGTQGNDSSWGPSISADGRYVAFESWASNLVPGDTNDQVPNGGGGDIFVHDRVTRQTTRVSVASDGAQGNDWWSWGASISADGRYVAFSSYASNLVPGDTNSPSWGGADVFVHDRVTRQTTRVSVASDGTEGNGHSEGAFISANGRYIIFDSLATNLVPEDTNEASDVFLHDRVTRQTTRVSLAWNGQQGGGGGGGSISADGRYVAFDSGADNLVTQDTNEAGDVFVHDRVTRQTTRVSVAWDGQQGARGSGGGTIFPDGQYVAFDSGAPNLVPADTNSAGDVFVHMLSTTPPSVLVTPPALMVSHTLGWTFLSVSIQDSGMINWAASVQTPDVDWLRITSGFSGVNDGTITFAYDANPNPQPRSATIRVNAPGATPDHVDVTLTQSAGEPPPRIMSREPTPDAVDVPVYQEIRAVFDSDLDPGTVNTNSVSLWVFSLQTDPDRPPGSVDVRWDHGVYYDYVNKAIVIVPVTMLQNKFTYSVTLSSLIRGANGVAINPQGWSFTTVAAPTSTEREDIAKAMRTFREIAQATLRSHRDQAAENIDRCLAVTWRDTWFNIARGALDLYTGQFYGAAVARLSESVVAVYQAYKPIRTAATALKAAKIIDGLGARAAMLHGLGVEGGPVPSVEGIKAALNTQLWIDDLDTSRNTPKYVGIDEVLRAFDSMTEETIGALPVTLDPSDVNEAILYLFQEAGALIDAQCHPQLPTTVSCKEVLADSINDGEYKAVPIGQTTTVRAAVDEAIAWMDRKEDAKITLSFIKTGAAFLKIGSLVTGIGAVVTDAVFFGISLGEFTYSVSADFGPAVTPGEWLNVSVHKSADLLADDAMWQEFYLAATLEWAFRFATGTDQTADRFGEAAKPGRDAAGLPVVFVGEPIVMDVNLDEDAVGNVHIVLLNNGDTPLRCLLVAVIHVPQANGRQTILGYAGPAAPISLEPHVEAAVAFEYSAPRSMLGVRDGYIMRVEGVVFDNMGREVQRLLSVDRRFRVGTAAELGLLESVTEEVSGAGVISTGEVRFQWVSIPRPKTSVL